MIIPTVEVHLDFEGFVRSSYPGLLGVARALTGGFHDAEDMVQDTMVKAFLKWDRVQRLESPGGWAHRVLVNRCTGWWRRKRTEARYMASVRRQEPVSAAPSADAIDFWRAVRQLPARHQQVMALHYAADMAVEDIARVMDTPAGTIRSDLTRARAALAVMLGR